MMPEMYTKTYRSTVCHSLTCLSEDQDIPAISGPLSTDYTTTWCIHITMDKPGPSGITERRLSEAQIRDYIRHIIGSNSSNYQDDLILEAVNVDVQYGRG